MTQSTSKVSTKEPVDRQNQEKWKKKGEIGAGGVCPLCRESRPVTRTVSRVRFLIFPVASHLLSFSLSFSLLRQTEQLHISYRVSHLPRMRWEPRLSRLLLVKPVVWDRERGEAMIEGDKQKKRERERDENGRRDGRRHWGEGGEPRGKSRLRCV